jgi:serine phosphatase RsbU (regulator of sigma subunit)
MQKIIVSAILLLYLCSFDSYSQIQRQSKIDSLNLELSQCKEDSNKVLLMFKLSENLRGEDVQRAIAIDKEALVLSKKIKYNFGIAKSLKGIGIGNYFIENYAEAIIFWEDAKKVYTEIGDLKGVANILSNMGAIYFNQSEYPKAIELYLQALKIAEKEKDTLRIATVWQNIGAVHNENADLALAIDAYEKALPLFKLMKNDEGTGLAYLNLGSCYNSKEGYKRATDNLTESLKYLSSTSYYAYALRTMGEIKSRTSNIEEALFYLDSAYNLALKAGDSFELTRTVNTIATAYLEKSDWQKASVYYEQGKALSIKSKANRELIISTSGLVKIYSLKGDYKKAFENQKILQNAQDSVYNLESNKKTNRLLFKYDLEKKENEISLLVKDKKIQQIEVEKQKGIRNSFIGGFLLVFLIAIGIFRNLQQNRKSKAIIENQKLIVEEKNREILDSIEYALRIQTAILPPHKIVKQYLENSFIIYKPKDIVAGDFYWMESINDVVLFAACDCTGHGVPGAMVSVVCHNALNRAVREFGLTQPAAILDKTTEIVLENFAKSEEEIQDGMDISICALNTKTRKLEWAGANNSLIFINNGQLFETKADKQCIGYNDEITAFTNHEFKIETDTIIYLFTDGFADQFGGQPERKLTKRKFKELLISIQHLSIQEQATELDKFITNYKINTEQTDDILVIGVRI